MKRIKLFALSDSIELGRDIAKKMEFELGKLKTEKFQDGEISVGFEETIRGRIIFIIGATHSSDAIVEMILTVDAAKRSGAKQVNLLIPYFGYARQDRKDKNRGAIGAAALTHVFKATGADMLMTVDLHANQIEGFFNGSVVHIQGKNVFMPFLRKVLNQEWVICSPDAGGVTRASTFANSLNLPLVVMNKRRDKPGSIASMELVGEVQGKKVLIIDDMVDTAGSLVKASQVLLDNGALEVCACITHGILSGEAKENIDKSSIKTVYISDTRPLKGKQLSDKIQVITSAEILARVIDRISYKKSVNEITSVI